MGCFGTYFTHAQSCDNVRVHTATQWTAFGTYFTHAQSCENVFQIASESAASVHTLHIPKAVQTSVFKVLQKGRLRYILYTCPKLDNVHVQSATEWAALVHTLHMPKAVITFVFILLYAMDRFGTYSTHAQSCDNVCSTCFGMGCWYILYTCPKLW